MDGREWDGRCVRSHKRPGMIEALYLQEHPYLLHWWEGPTNPAEARPADRIMADLGAILYEIELRSIEKRNGF